MILMASSHLLDLWSKKKKNKNGSLIRSLKRKPSKKIQNKTRMRLLETLSQYLKTRPFEQSSQSME
jgi:uncharacterized protein YeeX (DUF496 family)